ncbi:MAG: 30S ribosomal protein S7 [Ilumatobacteraceae bacterium]|jgi:small subunit ribosomal protein S7
MPRKGPAQRRELMPDPLYRSLLVTQIVNKVMLHGKRTVAEKIVYDALKIVEEKTGAEPISTLKRAVENIKPPLEVKSRRVGGATYQVPVEVRPRRANTLAIRWLVDFSRKRREKTMAECLANELLDASNGLGAAIKRRDDMQKMADSNRAFAHYRY